MKFQLLFQDNLDIIKHQFSFQEGAPIPSIELWENTPSDKVNIADLFKDKKGIIFGVPGAFTPGCSKTHLPGYVQDFDKIKVKARKSNLYFDKLIEICSKFAIVDEPCKTFRALFFQISRKCSLFHP